MTKRSLVLIALLLILPFPVRSSESRIRSVGITGNRTFGEGELLERTTTREDKSFSPAALAADIQILLRFYRKEGFCFAEVSLDSLIYSPDSSEVDVRLAVTEHDRVSIGEIVVEGNTVIPRDELVRRFDTQPGGFLESAVLEEDMQSILTQYERAGYPFAQVEVQTMDLITIDGEQKLRVGLRIDEGEQIRIREIRTNGNKETDAGVIVREIRIMPGELFNQEKIDKIRPRLNRLNIFSSVSEPELYVSTTGGGLLITVQEGSTNTFDGILGYVPGSSPGDGGRVTGLINIGMRNLFGTGRKLNVRWQRDDRQTQEIGAQYTEPWVLNFPVNLTGSFFQRQQDSSYIHRMVEFRADLLYTESLSFGGLFAHESVIPSSTTVIRAVSESRTVTWGLELRYDTRDDVHSPTGGTLYRTDYRIGTKTVPDPMPSRSQATTVQKIGLDGELYMMPFERQVLAVGLHGREITGENIENGDLFRFGGTRTLRGYRENQFFGSRIAWTNAEYRFLLARRSFVFGFVDTGYYFLEDDPARGLSSGENFKFGYGVGLRIETGIGNIGVSFALGEGDNFSQGKIHFGLINDF